MKDLHDYLEDVQRQISYWFEEPQLLFQAFTRRSYSQENGGANNEVLEFVGDRVLDFYVTKILMDRYGYQNDDREFLTQKYKNERDFTDIEKKLVNQKMLAHRIDLMGFQDYLYMCKGDIKENQQNQPSVKADLFEAILGAIAIDSEWNPDKLENSVKLMLNMEHYLINGFPDDCGLTVESKENGDVPENKFDQYDELSTILDEHPNEINLLISGEHIIMKDLHDYLEDVQRQIGYRFKEPKLLYQAFTRRSYSQENGGANNEVLEFVGDRVLDFYVTKILMDRYGYQNDDGEFLTQTYKSEGSLTDIKKKLVNKKMLAHQIDRMDFQDYLYMGKGDIQSNQQNEASVKEDLFEAILGAIAIDSKWNSDKLENSVKLMLNMDYYLSNGFTDDYDYVALVQQWKQKKNGGVPEYEFDELANGGFMAHLYLDTQRGEMHYSAYGDSKPKARANVAENAYNDLDEHDELFTETMLDELPEELTLDNSINTLQELAQKGYISMPEYDMPKDQVYDRNGNLSWTCSCYISSCSVKETAYATSKKITAKKYAAYLCICNICGLQDKYEGSVN